MFLGVAVSDDEYSGIYIAGVAPSTKTTCLRFVAQGTDLETLVRAIYVYGLPAYLDILALRILGQPTYAVQRRSNPRLTQSAHI